jgi:hypothetical protein
MFNRAFARAQKVAQQLTTEKTMRTLQILAVTALLAAAALPHALGHANTQQAANTYKIADQGDTITTGPSTTTLQVGVVGKNWTPTVTVTTYPVTISWANGGNAGAFGPDPDYGVVKEVSTSLALNPAAT